MLPGNWLEIFHWKNWAELVVTCHFKGKHRNRLGFFFWEEGVLSVLLPPPGESWTYTRPTPPCRLCALAWQCQLQTWKFYPDPWLTSAREKHKNNIRPYFLTHREKNLGGRTSLFYPLSQTHGYIRKTQPWSGFPLGHWKHRLFQFKHIYLYPLMSWSHQPKAPNATHSLCRTEASLFSLVLKFTFDFNGRGHELWCIGASSGKARADVWDGAWLSASSLLQSASWQTSCPGSGPCGAAGSPRRVPSQGHGRHWPLSPSGTSSPPCCPHEGSVPNLPARDSWTRSTSTAGPSCPFQAQTCSVRARGVYPEKCSLFPGNGGCAQGPDTTSLNEISVFFTFYLNCFSWVYLQVWN